MRIRMLIPITGTFHGLTAGVEAGQIVDVDDDNGAQYCKMGYAEPVKTTSVKEEHAVADDTETETSEPPRKGPGRPRKTV